MSWERLWAEGCASEDIRDQWRGFGMIRAEECLFEDIEVSGGKDCGLRNVHRKRREHGLGTESRRRPRRLIPHTFG